MVLMMCLLSPSTLSNISISLSSSSKSTLNSTSGSEVNKIENDSLATSAPSIDKKQIEKCDFECQTIISYSGGNKKEFISKVISTWPKTLTREQKLAIFENPPSHCFLKLKMEDIFPSHVSRKFLVTHAYKDNFFQHIREWILFDEINLKVLCLPCVLYSDEKNIFSIGGFDDWHNQSTSIPKHEVSASHNNSFLKWKEALNETNFLKTDKTREALKGIAIVLRFLALRKMATRGDIEVDNNVHNGHFRGIINLIAEFNERMYEHV